MKKQIMILAVSIFAISSMAQDPCEVKETPPPWNGDQGEWQTNEFGPHREKKHDPDRQEQMEKNRAKHQQRRLRLMERELKRIGVTEEEKAQIIQLQKMHKEKMGANAHRTEMTRERLSKLLDEGAPMEVLEEAIHAISAAQTEQLRILVVNRIEMERILGKEKHALFMQNARTQYQKHGRRGGPPLPPRPGLPPIPGQGHHHGDPPVPPHRPDSPPPPSED